MKKAALIMMSGRSKPPSVHCGIQLSAVPGRDPGIPSALFGLHPQGFTVPSIPADTLNELHCSMQSIAPPETGGARSFHCWRQDVSFLCHCHDSRHPRLTGAARPEGGGTFLSSPKGPPSAALSLSSLYYRAKCAMYSIELSMYTEIKPRIMGDSIIFSEGDSLL